MLQVLARNKASKGPMGSENFQEFIRTQAQQQTLHVKRLIKLLIAEMQTGIKLHLKTYSCAEIWVTVVMQLFSDSVCS